MAFLTTNAAMLGQGFKFTVLLAVLSWIIAFAGGVLLAAIRMIPSKACSLAVVFFVAFHRNVPLLAQVLFWYFGISSLLSGPGQHWLFEHGGGVITGCIALGLCTAAYVSEDIRSGIRSVSSGQSLAAAALGMSTRQVTLFVVLPQGLRAAIPTLTSASVTLLKNTSVLMVIGITEFTYATREIEEQTFETFKVFGIAAMVYLGLSVLIIRVGRALEHHYQVSRT